MGRRSACFAESGTSGHTAPTARGKLRNRGQRSLMPPTEECIVSGQQTQPPKKKKEKHNRRPRNQGETLVRTHKVKQLSPPTETPKKAKEDGDGRAKR